MKGRPQWVSWRYEREGKGNENKVPIDPHRGRRADVTDPRTWPAYNTALKATEEHGYDGVGFVFSEDDPYTGIDIDDCLDPERAEISSAATEIAENLASYTEVSPSGNGLKCWVKAQKPDKRCKTKAEGHNIEVFDCGSSSRSPSADTGETE